MSKSTAIFGGAGLGILIGLLIGMSTSGTVGLVIGALASALLVLLGFKEQGESSAHALRIGAFGLSCSVAILVGLFFRVNNSFTPSVSAEIERWTADSLFTLDEAKTYVLYDKFGFLPEEVRVDSSMDMKRGQTVLYSDEVTESDCEKLRSYERFSIAEEIDAYRRLGGVWQRIATSVEGELEAARQGETLHIMRRCLCKEE